MGRPRVLRHRGLKESLEGLAEETFGRRIVDGGVDESSVSIAVVG